MASLIPWLKAAGMAVFGAFLVACLELAVTMLTDGRDPWTRDALQHMAKTGMAAAVVVLLAYVRNSPLARREWSEEEREAERQKLAAQGRLKVGG